MVECSLFFWKLECLMFVSSIISESSNVSTMYLFSYIRMFGSPTFVCSQDPDCLDVLMFAHEQMFNIPAFFLISMFACSTVRWPLIRVISESHRKPTVMKVHSRSFSVIPTHSMTSSWWTFCLNWRSLTMLVNVQFYLCWSVSNRMDRKILFQVDVPKIHF